MPIYKKRWFWLVAGMVAIILIAGLGGCKEKENKNKGTDNSLKSALSSDSNERRAESADNETTEQKNAVRKAKAYLELSGFSREGLIEQLEYEQFSLEDAAYGADHCGADWNEQALRKAKSYLETSAFSYQGLIEQLKYEKFTEEQAAYGADHCGADWNEQAVKKAKSYLELASFSRDSLIEQLEFDQFTHEQAVYAAEKNGL